jgi:hypothetical protein
MITHIWCSQECIELVTMMILKNDKKLIVMEWVFRFYVKVSEHTMLHRKHFVKFLDQSLILVT